MAKAIDARGADQIVLDAASIEPDFISIVRRFGFSAGTPAKPRL
jgi:hypothetical protein